MDKLDQYIKNHQQAFEEEPAAGHFERLQQKINIRHRKTISRHRWNLAAAASLLLLLSAGVILQQRLNRPSGLIALCENSEDMKQCYLSKINDVIYRIDELSKTFDMEDWEREAVMDDIHDLLQNNNDFEKELPEELPEDVVNSILSDYYQRNLESLHTIVQALEEK